ncbi:MAG: hypothetical protein GY913_36040 [Proteobacteria bacterium]|nr:hypothetical protein [Pseudomonadota bacterium]MCP4922342.1 hypothetical protein [Pseudomonadota bacterium]
MAHVVVRGMGAVSAAGDGIGPLRELLRSGRTAIRPLTRFQPSGPPIGALVESPPSPDRDDDPDFHQELGVSFGVRAALEALGDTDPEHVALVVGTNLEDRPRPLDELAHDLAARVGLRGPVVTCSSACASSATAVGHALRLLDRGVARVLVGGFDVVSPRLHAGFHRLNALASAPCSPFSTRTGISLGDGSAFVLLELRDDAHPTGLNGWATRADAHHPTAPAPDGRGVRSALSRAWAQAGEPEIDWVSAHGTGTEANDAAEWRGIQRVLGDVPVSAPKSQLGHTQGAAGMLELVAALIARDAGFLPATAGFHQPRPGAPPDCVPQVRTAELEHVASVSCGFGGVNTAIVAGPSRSWARPQRPVHIAAIGRVESPEPLDPRDLKSELRSFDPRDADPSTLWLLAAIRRAWAGRRLGRDERAATGLIVAQRCTSPARIEELDRRLHDQGLDAMGAVLFSRSLPIVPGGACSLELGLRGPVDVVLGDPDEALDHGRWLLATEPELAGMLVVHVREAEPDHPDEGAVAIWLRPGVPTAGQRVMESGTRFTDAY